MSRLIKDFLTPPNLSHRNGGRGEKRKEVHAGQVKNQVLASLEEMKAVEIIAIEVSQLTDITDYVIVAGGNSKRHIAAIADKIWEDAKKQEYEMLGMEGREGNEWVLIDLNCVVAHIMLPEQREYYRLEDVWQVGTEPSAIE